MIDLHIRSYQVKSRLELLIWSSGILYISLVPPDLFQFCFFKWIGLPFCPGCGLGHGIYHLVHGQLMQSWQHHPLAIPALLITTHRIITLLKLNFKKPTVV